MKKLVPALLAFLAFLGACAADKGKPNIMLILTDDQDWGDIGYNNPEHVYTPNLDRLAAEGAVFAQHYVMPQCTPTRVAALTGRYPGRFGTTPLQATNGTCFTVGTPTLATLLKAAGYQTYLSGKWHMGVAPEQGPNHHGFDHSYGSLAGAVGGGQLYSLFTDPQEQQDVSSAYLETVDRLHRLFLKQRTKDQK